MLLRLWKRGNVITSRNQSDLRAPTPNKRPSVTFKEQEEPRRGTRGSLGSSSGFGAKTVHFLEELAEQDKSLTSERRPISNGGRCLSPLPSSGPPKHSISAVLPVVAPEGRSPEVEEVYRCGLSVMGE